MGDCCLGLEALGGGRDETAAELSLRWRCRTGPSWSGPPRLLLPPTPAPFQQAKPFPFHLALGRNPVVWANRAACFLRLDKHEKALQDAQVARTLDPNYVKVSWRA